MGTFRPGFDAAERLEFVLPSYANRAHNDYLEYLLEAGVAGALLVVWAMIFAVYRISVTLRRNDDRKIRVQTLFAVGSLLGLLLHSLVDYPMRSASLGVLAGFVVGLVSRAGGGSAVRSSRGVRD